LITTFLGFLYISDCLICVTHCFDSLFDAPSKRNFWFDSNCPAFIEVKSVHLYKIREARISVDVNVLRHFRDIVER
jgi:hypothetical protein